MIKRFFIRMFGLKHQHLFVAGEIYKQALDHTLSFMSRYNSGTTAPLRFTAKCVYCGKPEFECQTERSE